MSWLCSLFYPLKPNQWCPVFILPGVFTLLGLLFWVIVSGGFLFVVGIRASSLQVALFPGPLVFLFLLAQGLGYIWRLQGEAISFSRRWLKVAVSIAAIGLMGFALGFVLCLSIIGLFFIPGLCVFLGLSMLYQACSHVTIEEVSVENPPCWVFYPSSVKTTSGFSEYVSQPSLKKV